MSGILFEGGPNHGRVHAVKELPRVVNVAWMPPLPLLESPPPRPRWWRHPLRWYRWRPAPLPPIPEPQQLAYRDTGETRDGRHVYRPADWPWFKGPKASAEGDLYHALATACYAVHPRVRQDTETRWVMDLGWYKRIRAIAVTAGDDDPEKWKPDPEDRLMGIRIDVKPDGGAPHLENRRYPQDYP